MSPTMLSQRKAALVRLAWPRPFPFLPSSPDADPVTTHARSPPARLQVKEIQTYVGLKKLAVSQLNRVKSAPLASSTSAGAALDLESGGPSAGLEASSSTTNPIRGKNLTNQDLIQKGRKMMDETDDSLMRSVRVLEQTKQIGADTAAALQEQTATAERIVNKLDEIEFTLKKSGVLIRHLTRSVAMDKCFQFLIGLIGIGVIMIIILNLTGKDKGAVQLPGEEGESEARRLLRRHLS